MKPDSANALCLECGLCCNGAIFSRGQLQPDEDAERLRSLGLILTSASRTKSQGPKFKQPCGAFDGCRCRIYDERPQYCRQFDCLLLKSVKAGETNPASARRIIRIARQRFEKVKRLLRKLGDADEHQALNLRFQKTQKRIEAGHFDENAAATFGELTLAIHDLNLILSERFYSDR